MARGKKKESALTPEEKLAQALVPVEEQPYKVPENWCWVKLSALSDLISKGTTPTGGKNAYVSEGVHFLRVENINDDGTISHDNIACVTEEMHTGFLKRSVLHSRDVLVSIAGTLGKTGIVRDVDLPLNTNQAVAFVRLKSEAVNERYIKWVIDNPITQELLLGKTKVTSIPNLTLEIIGDCPIPLTPIAEQQRIVDRIEYLFAKLDEAKEKAQSVLDSFETRKAAILHKAFTGELTAKWRTEHGVELGNWENLKLGEIGTLERGRSQHRPRNDPRLFDGPYPFIQTGDVASANVYVTEHRQTLSEFGMAQSRMFPAGTLCITIAANIGDVAILSYDCCFPDSVVGFTPNNRSISKFIYYMMSVLQKELEDNAPATAQKNINLKILNAVEISVPTVEEQTEIVRILDSLFAKEQQAKEAAETVLEKIDLLKKSILARAFRGELGTNDPTEESAVELIKSVLSEKIQKDKPKSKREKKKPEVEFVAKTIMQALSAGGKITPEKLKSETGLLIDDFYDQLKILIDSDCVVETRIDGESYLEAKNEDRQPNN